MTMQTITHRIGRLALREGKRMCSRPLYVFCMVIAPLFCYIFFTTLMSNGLPTNLPVGVVDQDNTSTTRAIVRQMDVFQQTHIVARYPDVTEARHAMQRGEIYAFYYIPHGTTEDAIANRQPRVSFYTNGAYLIAGSLLYKDLLTMSVLANAAVGQQTLLAHGATERQALGFLQPIVIDTHPLNNPWLNYSVYLSNTLIPGILMLLIFLVTVYAIGSEVKEGTSHEWIHTAGDNLPLALAGKLLPHTIIFTVMAAGYDVYLYGVLGYPCNSGIGPMLLAALLLVLASQSFGIFLYGLLPSLRFALSAASLWGVLSFSISGFSFPVMAMHPTLQALSILFPLRHYFLIYVDQALNGYSLAYSWQPLLALLIFTLLPLFILKRLHNAIVYYRYIP